MFCPYQGKPRAAGSVAGRMAKHMIGFIQQALNSRRSFETALADLVAEYQRDPRPGLARTIDLIRAEILLKKGLR